MCRRYALFLLMVFSSVFVAKASKSYGFAINNFTLTDIEGNQFDLDQMMREGKHVILNFGTTWAPSSWSYEKTQSLSNINKLYKMDGKDNVVILFLETDLNTDVACIKGDIGCSFASMGDWSELIDYPIINLTKEELSYLQSYQIDEYPTVYGIKPDRTISSLGQADMNRVISWVEGTSYAMGDVKAINFIADMAKLNIMKAMDFSSKSKTADLAPLIAENSKNAIKAVDYMVETQNPFKYSLKFSDEDTDFGGEDNLSILDMLVFADSDFSKHRSMSIVGL
ncbi:MAG TPA: hypothetical protein PKD85_11010 [Saprospiraceae bacterium]|nr:hypothetical protein [Saprospiraceae bacterium]